MLYEPIDFYSELTLSPPFSKVFIAKTFDNITLLPNPYKQNIVMFRVTNDRK